MSNLQKVCQSKRFGRLIQGGTRNNYVRSFCICGVWYVVWEGMDFEGGVVLVGVVCVGGNLSTFWNVSNKPTYRGFPLLKPTQSVNILKPWLFYYMYILYYERRWGFWLLQKIREKTFFTFCCDIANCCFLVFSSLMIYDC